MAEISEVFNQEGSAFVNLTPGVKNPPLRKEWQKNLWTFQEAKAHSGNVGILAGDGFIGLDQDDPGAFKGMELPTSTKWETRPGRFGLRFHTVENVAEALATIGKKTDLAQLKLFKDGRPVGEVKLQRSYQVIPPSWKTLDDGSRVDYKIIVESPPAEISLKKLLADLQGIGITFSSNLEKNAAKLENMGRKARQSRAESDEARIRRYALAALESESKTLAGTPKGGRNDQLNRSAFNMGQFIAAGALDEAEVVSDLTRAAKNMGLEPDEIDRTIRSGLESGQRHPRQIPQPENTLTHGEHHPEKNPEIRSKALDILQTGDPIQSITDNCGRMVLGAEKAFRKLICCKAVQGVRQSAGLHPKLSGESGSGKTWAVLTFAHHLPAEAVIKGSSSNLAAFYHQDGNQVFRILDDYQAGNETLDTVIKQTSSVFHQPYDHRTVKKQEPLTLHIGSEQTWAVTSVDSSQDVQVLNRQIPINVDDSEELTVKVNRRTIERYGKGQEQFPEDESVQICREIWRILHEDGLINVRIPYFERIEWLDTSNRRNPSLFMDLVVAHAAMYRYQREKDSDGYYLATEDDFQAAKALFTDNDAEELVHRLTKKEREFAYILCMHPEGLTRDEAAKSLNISGNRISQLANGEKGRGGLTQKLPGFEIVEVTDSERMDEDHRRATKKVLYRLTKYDPLTGFEAVVRLLPKNDISSNSKDGKQPVSLPVRKLVGKEIDNKERENREKEIGSKDSKEEARESNGQIDKTSKISHSLSKPEKSLLKEKSASEAHGAILTEMRTNPYSPYSMSDDIESKSLPTEEQPNDPQQAGKDNTSEKIRVAAYMEFGVNGEVDPAKVATCLRIPTDKVVAWLDANYIKLERPNGVVRYIQRAGGGEARA
jgi:hypothetical protein